MVEALIAQNLVGGKTQNVNQYQVKVCRIPVMIVSRGAILSQIRSAALTLGQSACNQPSQPGRLTTGTTAMGRAHLSF